DAGCYAIAGDAPLGCLQDNLSCFARQRNADASCGDANAACPQGPHAEACPSEIPDTLGTPTCLEVVVSGADCVCGSEQCLDVCDGKAAAFAARAGPQAPQTLFDLALVSPPASGQLGVFVRARGTVDVAVHFGGMSRMLQLELPTSD